MYRKTLILVLMLCCGIGSYAGTGKELLQDSVKRVTITISAREKLRQVNLDSLLKAQQAGNKSEKVSERKVKRNAGKPERKSRTDKSAGKESSSFSNPSKESPKTLHTASKPSPPPANLKDTAKDRIGSRIQKDGNPTLKPHIKAARTYLWVGIALALAGIVFGILFGKTAFLVSLAGVIFIIIGYYLSR